MYSLNIDTNQITVGKMKGNAVKQKGTQDRSFACKKVPLHKDST